MKYKMEKISREPATIKIKQTNVPEFKRIQLKLRIQWMSLKGDLREAKRELVNWNTVQNNINMLKHIGIKGWGLK